MGTLSRIFLFCLTLSFARSGYISCSNATLATPQCDQLHSNDIQIANLQAWNISYHPSLYTDRCNIARSSALSVADFIANFETTEPVIITDVTDNQLFRTLNEKKNLLDSYGDHMVKLSTANTHSYDKTMVLFSDYILYMMEDQVTDRSGKDTLYHFGDNDLENFKPLFDQYIKPPYPSSLLRGTISWGLGGSGTGVPFHTHGAVFAEVLHGMKRWFLYPPGAHPNFDPNDSTLKWMEDIYPLVRENGLYECMLRPGEILYLPHGWWHATLNLGQSVFISVFV
ncbi:jmjC domain-containing protein 8-like [Planoprotostelium fungivorum]|uniref:JmjC domain-containing protein 8-like n=1 Tax=Planoprotostelium fungivorum TaxID=1890364 RepID=A0A2P6NNY9_9EUKA|nr:jmjC domain-containing protein 8-like [Planoprotostelium fungivorum]